MPALVIIDQPLHAARQIFQRLHIQHDDRRGDGEAFEVAGSFVGTTPDTDNDGQLERFGATELHVILNFFEELKARVPN